MASHQAPPGALMVYKDELQSMALSVRRLADMNQDLLRVLSPFLVSENDSPITAIRRILKDLASTKAKLAEASKGAQEKPLNHSMD